MISHRWAHGILAPVFAGVGLLAIAMMAAAEPPLPDGRCDDCGGCVGVRRTCVAKQVVREKKKICWDAKCVPHCIPGPSVHGGTAKGKDECGCYDHDVWKPTCARVATKTVPVKREVIRKVPGIEWGVEERCAACRQRLAKEPTSNTP